MARPAKYGEPMTDVIQFRVTSTQKEKESEWPDMHDYLRLCIENRYTGEESQLRDRANHLRQQAQQLQMEAQELDRIAEGMTDASDARWQVMLEEFKQYNIHTRPREEKVKWLTGRYSVDVQEANEFLAFVGDAREAFP